MFFKDLIDVHSLFLFTDLNTNCRVFILFILNYKVNISKQNPYNIFRYFTLEGLETRDMLNEVSEI